MDFFYDLPLKTQAYICIAWGIMCLLVVFFWTFHIALKAQRKREREWKEGVTINITIKDSSASPDVPEEKEEQQQPVHKEPHHYTWKNYLMLFLYILIFGILIYQLFF